MNCTWLLTVYTWLQFDCRDNHTNNELNLPNSCKCFVNGLCILKSIWLNVLSKCFSVVNSCRILSEDFVQFNAQTSAETLLLPLDSLAFHVFFLSSLSSFSILLGLIENPLVNGDIHINGLCIRLLCYKLVTWTSTYNSHLFIMTTTWNLSCPTAVV